MEKTQKFKFTTQILLLAILIMVFLSCEKDTDPATTDYGASLQTMIDSNWNAYWAGHPSTLGVLEMKINTPTGDYFVSSNLGSSATQTTHFRGGSTTKTFTAASIMLLDQQGKLNISDPITNIIPGTSQTYLPETPEFDIPFKNDITIKLLLQHRAGIFDLTNTPIPDTVEEPYAGLTYNNYVDFVLGDSTHHYTFEESVAILAKHQLTYGAPDIEFHYSNVGYMLLGQIVERVSGQDFDAFVSNNFSQILNMDNTLFTDDPFFRSLPEPFVPGYVIYEGTPMDVTPFVNPSSGVATGNIITTCNDLNIWIKNLLEGKAGVDKNRINEMMDCDETMEEHGYYGLGINYTPGLGYGHNGGVWGYMTVTRYNPDNHVAFTINASYIEMDDIYKEADLLYSVAHQSLAIMGYE